MPADGLLTGVGASAGTVEAAVRVILDPAGDLSVNGSVLCTVRTDPGWGPLFPTCSGLVTERGSTLSHSAVIAREMGIPAVVGVAGATTVLRDAARVRVDGSAGTVELLAVADDPPAPPAAPPA
jgi:pyruvate,water dikinase